MAHHFHSEPLAAAGERHAPLMGDFPRSAGNSAGRVLIVDDEPLIRWSLSETLAGSGYEILEAGDAQSALLVVAAAAGRIDVVLLDFRLPDSNDLALLARLRGLLPESRIILMTAFGTPEMAQEARDLGAFDVVGKPFEMNDLASLVRTASPLAC